MVLYLPTDLSNQKIRVFYYSSVGAALALAVFLIWLTHRVVRQPLVFAAIVGALSAVGFMPLLSQRQAYVDASDVTQARLTELARILPRVESGSMVVVIDEVGEFYTAVGTAFYFEYQLPILEGDYSLDAALCLPEQVGSDEYDRCRFTAADFATSGVRRGYVSRPYSQLIVIRLSPEGFSVLDELPFQGLDYNPELLIGTAQSPPNRVDRLFGNPP